MAQITDEMIKEINELSKKSKTIGLTEEEKQRQQYLRTEYIKAFRGNFKQQLQSITVVDKKGNDITPEKIKNLKKHH